MFQTFYLFVLRCPINVRTCLHRIEASKQLQISNGKRGNQYTVPSQSWSVNDLFREQGNSSHDAASHSLLGSGIATVYLLAPFTTSIIISVYAEVEFQNIKSGSLVLQLSRTSYPSITETLRPCIRPTGPAAYRPGTALHSRRQPLPPSNMIL